MNEQQMNESKHWHMYTGCRFQERQGNYVALTRTGGEHAGASKTQCKPGITRGKSSEN